MCPDTSELGRTIGAGDVEARMLEVPPQLSGDKRRESRGSTSSSFRTSGSTRRGSRRTPLTRAGPAAPQARVGPHPASSALRSSKDLSDQCQPRDPSLVAPTTVRPVALICVTLRTRRRTAVENRNQAAECALPVCSVYSVAVFEQWRGGTCSGHVKIQAVRALLPTEAS
jgi:hypothetical protein